MAKALVNSAGKVLLRNGKVATTDSIDCCCTVATATSLRLQITWVLSGSLDECDTSMPISGTVGTDFCYFPTSDTTICPDSVSPYTNCDFLTVGATFPPTITPVVTHDCAPDCDGYHDVTISVSAALVSTLGVWQIFLEQGVGGATFCGIASIDTISQFETLATNPLHPTDPTGIYEFQYFPPNSGGDPVWDITVQIDVGSIEGSCAP